VYVSTFLLNEDRVSNYNTHLDQLNTWLF